MNVCMKEKNSFQITHNPIHLLVCFGYQSPYAGEMFDILSENDFFSVDRVITSSKLSSSHLSASNFVYTPSEIDMTFVPIFSTSYKIY